MMDVDTGDSLLVTQKPYNMPLRHITLVQREIEPLKKAGIIV